MEDPEGTATTYAAPTRSVAHADEPAAAGGEVLPPGTPVGRYVVASHVGAGGMGRVYAAYDPELDRRVALKLLRAEHDDAHGRRGLVEEARALAKLAHPHVVAVHDVGTVGDQVFVAMEFVPGTTLHRALAERRRSWREVLELLRPVAQGLAAVHDAGLVHRDVKPANVMLGDDGRVRVMDFGLARAAAREVTATHDEPERGEALALTITRSGTPPYMAPEQWRGLVADARTDQFAFCVTAWEAFYGKRPFEGGTLAALERSITAGRPSPPPRDAEVPRWLRRVLERGLRVEPDERFPSMTALLAAIARGRRRARLRWLAAASAAVGTAVATMAFVAPVDLRPVSRFAEAVAAARPARCERHEVCAKGPLVAPACQGTDGTLTHMDTACRPGDPAHGCPQGETCLGMRGVDEGRCAPICQVLDDRPACMPGCFNQQCEGVFDVCAREHGVCAPVPCTSDEACEAIATCDFPTRGSPGFRCNLEAGYCERARPQPRAG